MSFLLSGPVLFFEVDELEDLIVEFSDRLRREVALRNTLNELVGNRWADAEKAAESFFAASLFADRLPDIDANWLSRAVQVLSAAEVDQMADILVDCALCLFPLNSAATFSEVTTELASALKAVISADGVERQRRLLKVHRQLTAGALFSGF